MYGSMKMESGLNLDIYRGNYFFFGGGGRELISTDLLSYSSGLKPEFSKIINKPTVFHILISHFYKYLKIYYNYLRNIYYST